MSGGGGIPMHDAHCHLQDPRLKELPSDPASIPATGYRVTNATHPGDWQATLNEARQEERVIPCLGVHPWKVGGIETGWETHLETLLKKGGVGVGEIGLDRWIPDPNLKLQREILEIQLDIATRHNLPTTLHCLRAWGPLLETLKGCPLPERGFLIHAYGGSVEMLDRFLELGARISFSAYFLDPSRKRKLKPFQHVPLEAILIETDAPDMPPPEDCFPGNRRYRDASGNRVNLPETLPHGYAGLAKLRGLDLEELKSQVDRNFRRFFQPLI